MLWSCFLSKNITGKVENKASDSWFPPENLPRFLQNCIATELTKQKF